MTDRPALTLIHGEGLDGLCPRCGETPLPDGYRICSSCAERMGPVPPPKRRRR